MTNAVPEVRRHFPGRSPIGARLVVRETAQAAPAVREIVGVARQVKSRPDEVEDLLQIYVPLAQDTPGDIFISCGPPPTAWRGWPRPSAQRSAASTAKAWSASAA